MQNGKIGVTTENIFPIIKKFLYSDHEIFLRELVSNAVDATQKLKTYSSIGEFKGVLGELAVTVSLDSEKKILTISDNGIGLTAEEIDKYINQIAFSGAEEFMQKYENQSIIGHFGLGFYSSFMVSDKVEIRSKSFKDGSKTVLWSCDGTPEYTLVECEEQRSERGTDIIIYLNEESIEFASKAKIESLLKKYCRFLPIPIKFGKKTEWKDGKDVETDEDNIINSVAPLWTRKPSDVKEEEYQSFYHTLYPSTEDALFNIHLNIDYPFNLTGILYFPKINNNFEIQKNKIQLYCNQVYVTDSVEGIVPEFLTLLHGIIDSPDIPLNVSRSYLQSDSNVKKISGYITRKVADRLQELFNSSRDEFEKKWDDLKIFIQYGTVSDEKFADKSTGFSLLKNTEGKYFTAEEYKTLVTENQTDKTNSLIYLYTNDKEGQYSFIEAAKAKGYDVLEMNGQLDNHFIGWFESKNEGTRFVRVDSDVVDKLIQKENSNTMSLDATQQDVLTPVFQAQLPTNDKTQYMVSFEAMESSDAPVIITQNEFMRRMKDMSASGNGGMYQFYGQMPDSYNVTVNGNHPLVMDILNNVEEAYGDDLKSANSKIESAIKEQSSLTELLSGKKDDEISTPEKDLRTELSDKVNIAKVERESKLKELGAENKVVKQVIDLALLANGMLKGKQLDQFIRRSVELIEK